MGRVALLAFALAIPLAAQTPIFLEKPYLQLGDHPKLLQKEEESVVWHSPDVDAEWAVRYVVLQPKQTPHTVAAHVAHRVAVAGIEPHRVYEAKLTELGPGDEFEYEVLRNDKSVFQSKGRARPGAHQFYRMVVFGDCGADTPAQREIAFQTHQLHPDMVFITGDIVYSRGRISEYRTKWFPVYNSDEASPVNGAPLLRSTLFLAAVGNHDVGGADVGTNPDGLAYFNYWMQPLNGPVEKPGAPGAPLLRGPEEAQKAFLDAANGTYPRMANFSFDYGNTHWTVLDGDPYVDWTRPEMRDWLTNDLRSAKNATWKFVAFHHPGFNSSQAHFSEQQMRLVAEICEREHVDLVFTGHVHNYQRSMPLRFLSKGKKKEGTNLVEGDFTIDREYDGVKKTKPKGVIYLVTGGGGANLYNTEQEKQPEGWQQFTKVFISTKHSLTVADVRANQLTVRQIGDDGSELDQFVITK